MRRTARLTLATLTALTTAGLSGGCLSNTMWYPGGSLRSNDQYTYWSTAHNPTTVSIIDTRTDQVIWSTDIPVDMQLVINFEEDEGDDNRVTPAKMYFDTWKLGRTSGTPRQSINVPAADARRIDVKQRAVPELPFDMKPADSPQPRLDYPQGN
jgi:hypothetical protein